MKVKYFLVGKRLILSLVSCLAQKPHLTTVSKHISHLKQNIYSFLIPVSSCCWSKISSLIYLLISFRNLNCLIAMGTQPHKNFSDCFRNFLLISTELFIEHTLLTIWHLSQFSNVVWYVAYSLYLPVTAFKNPNCLTV